MKESNASKEAALTGPPIMMGAIRVEVEMSPGLVELLRTAMGQRAVASEGQDGNGPSSQRPRGALSGDVPAPDWVCAGG